VDDSETLKHGPRPHAYPNEADALTGPASSIYVAYNGWIDPVTAAIPTPMPGKSWHVVADTSAAAEAWATSIPLGRRPT
jgi:isoamylase-like protein